MSIISKILGKTSEDKKEFKEKFKQEQQNRKVERRLNEMEMSSNERDLLARMEKKREEGIKIQLDAIRKKETSDMWKSKNGIMSDKMTILKEDKPILKEKNIFKDNPNLFTKEHSIKHNTDMGFFK